MAWTKKTFVEKSTEYTAAVGNNTELGVEEGLAKGNEGITKAAAAQLTANTAATNALSSLAVTRERYPIRTPEEFGAKGEAGHDDALPITEAINKVVEEGILNGHYYGEVIFKSRLYNCERAPVEGGSTKGNSQIPLPIVSPENQQKFTLGLMGTLDATSGPHWHQEVNQLSGSVLNCQLTTGSSGTWGVPSVIGGPTKYADPSGGVSFTNMLLVTDGITITQQKNPTVIGCDSRQLAQHNVVKMCCMVRATPTELAASLPTNELGIGLYLPITGNNDNNNVDWFTSYGHYTGMVASEHLVANRIATIYGNKNLVIVGLENTGTGPVVTGHVQHGGVVNYFTSEVCKTTHLEAIAAKYPIVINMMSCESGEGTYDITDSENILYGQINFECTAGSPGTAANARINGGKHLRVKNLFVGPGEATGPSAAELEAEVLNPFQNDAVATIVNAEEIKVDGQKQLIPAAGVATPIYLPANKKIKCVKVTGKTIESKWTVM